MTESITETGKTLIGFFELQNRIFENAIDGINDVDALQRPNEQTNHINWLLGHLLASRVMLANHIGLKLDNPYQVLYFKPLKIGESYYRLEVLTTDWKRVSEQLLSFLASLSLADWEQELEGKGTNVQDFTTFFAYHEAYHLGQIGYIRKLLDLKPMKTY